MNQPELTSERWRQIKEIFQAAVELPASEGAGHARRNAPGILKQTGPPFYMALLYTGLGQKDTAFRWLRQAYQERAYRMVYLKVDPAFASLRSDPRFDALLREIGLVRTN